MLTQDADYFYWDKGDAADLSPYFSTGEYTCHCHNTLCRKQKISRELIRRNTEIRRVMNSTIRVTSGYRCDAKQSELELMGAETAKKSQHTLGNASDLAASDMSLLHALCEQYYSAIGTALSFIHVDTRPPHEDGSKRRWSYERS